MTTDNDQSVQGARAGYGNLPPLPEPEALGMCFERGWDGERAYGYTEEHMHAYARAAQAAFRAAAPAVNLIEAVETYLEAQGALDNRDLMGPNAPPYEVLRGSCNQAYATLDDALSAAKKAVAPAQFADGDSPCVLEWGAVSLPVGDPSRITEMKLCPTLWDAIAEGALCGFDWRVYPMAEVANRSEFPSPATADGGANG